MRHRYGIVTGALLAAPFCKGARSGISRGMYYAAVPKAVVVVVVPRTSPAAQLGCDISENK